MEDQHDPIAIVGMSCRFPGDADTPQGFWDLLSRGESAWSEVPKDRFNIDAYYHPSAEREGAVITKSGFFLKQNVSKWDAGFFSMTASEAAGTDPQQRMLLEVTYEAFENAGIPLTAVAGTSTSCYIGAFHSDYGVTSTSEMFDGNPYSVTGLGKSMLSNRLSWFFDLRGPSMTIDTACSSGLVALHLGVQSLRSGEARMAVVGGANLLLEPSLMRSLSVLHFLSPDGKCHSFDASANGYARGEGFGVVVLKPLKDALNDNDTIRAVIRGSGLNQDGKTPGITMPSRDAQSDLISQTYRTAGLDFDRTTYFEAHGTGTAIGDPIELSAIGRSLGARRSSNNPLYVGSVKTNLGHLEPVAGLAGLIKTVLSIENGVIPKIVGLDSVNPRLQLDDWGLRLNTELLAWPTPGLRRASVNSFGYGGANAHVILDDAKHYLQEHGLQGNHSTKGDGPESTDSGSDSGVSVGTPPLEAIYSYKPTRSPPKLLVLSSPEQAGVARLAQTYAEFLETKKCLPEGDPIFNDTEQLKDATYIEDLAYTLGERRTAFAWRTFAVSRTLEEFQEVAHSGLPKLRRTIRNPACAFVFTGQGSQYFNMGRELQSNSTFLGSLQSAEEYLHSLGCGWSVLEEFNKPEEASKINDPELSQPLCTILQVAIVDLLKHWGVFPRAVVGHSSGEIAAAYAAGALSQKDAWKIAYFRGLHSGRLATAYPKLSGSMMAVAISETDALEYVSKATTGKVVVACINSPSSVTLSGDKTAIDELAVLLKSDEIWGRKLKVNTAYHSHHMKFIADDYLKSIEDISLLTPDGSVAMFSSVTEQKVVPADLGPSYWVRNMLSTVRFSGAVTALLSPMDPRSRRQKMPSVQSLIEIGPHSVLKSPLSQILAATVEGYKDSVNYMSVLHRGNDAYETSLVTAGKLWAQGHVVDLGLVNSFNENCRCRKVLSDLPPYPWNHERSHWHEPRSNISRRLLLGPRTDLLGRATDNFNPLNTEYRWTNFIKPQEMPWLLEHVIQDLVVFPGAAMISMALEACQQIADSSKSLEGFEFRDINFTRALVFQSPDQTAEVAMQLRPHVLGTKDSTFVWHKFHFTSITKDNIITEHGNGLIRTKYAVKPSVIENGMEATLNAKAHKDAYEKIYNETADRSASEMYDLISERGMQFGPLFRLLSDMRGAEECGCASLVIPDTASVMPEGFEYPLLLHPAVLDGFFQMVFSRTSQRVSPTSVLSSVGSLYVSASLPNSPGTTLRCYQNSTIEGHRDIVANVVVSNPDFEKPYVVIKNAISISVGNSTAERAARDEETTSSLLATHLVWKEDVSSLSQNSTCPLPASANIDVYSDDEILRRASQNHNRSLLSQEEPDPASGFSCLPKPLESDPKSSADEGAFLTFPRKSLLGQAAQALESTLLEIASGLLDPSKLVFESGFSGEVRLKNETLREDSMNSKVAAWFDMAGYQNPDLQILEISNGSTSTAVSVLNKLSEKTGGGHRYGHYTFTTSHSSHFEEAKGPFTRFVNTEIKDLDIEFDPIRQGFDQKKYDIVLISNPTADIEATLQNAKTLLKPGGAFVIVALASVTCRAALVLDTIDQCWLRDSNKGFREINLSVILEENGMSTAQIATQDSELGNLQQMSMVVSTLPKITVPSQQPVVIVETERVSTSAAALAKHIEDRLKSQGFTVLRKTLLSILDAKDTIFISLLDLDSPLLEGISENSFNLLKSLLTRSSGLLWLTRGGIKRGPSLPYHFATSGLFRTILSEAPHLHLVTLDLSPATDITTLATSCLVTKLFSSSFRGDEDSVVEHEYAEEDGVVYVPRLVQEKAMNSSLSQRNSEPTVEMQKLFQPSRPLKMIIGEIGLLDSLKFVDREEYQHPLPADQVDIKILYTGLNFVDTMASLGYIHSLALGAEFAGVVTDIGRDVPEGKFYVGQMVVGASEHCFASNIRLTGSMLHSVPENLAPEAAATCLIAYATAYFSLYENGKLKKDDTILIHSAAGGLGQAAVQLAKHIGAVVYCTVGSLDKKQLLMERYQIPENHIFSSRDTTFAQGLMRETKGRGVDVILNSTFGEMLRESWNCLADFGIFVEVGKRDILANNSLEMGPFIRGCTFTAVNLAQYAESCEMYHLHQYNDVVKKVFDLLGEGHITPPYPLQVMSITQADEAFRSLQSGKMSGKIVLKMDDDAIVPVMPREKSPLALHPNATYLLAGGLGGIGRSLADLMVKHGAKHIAFVSRSGDARDEVKPYLCTLRDIGVQAIAYTCDIADRTALEEMLQKCAGEMPQIKGFVNCAMFLKDAIFENMTHMDWVAATRPKMAGSWNMHELLPLDMDFFIMLSSISGIIGNPGQANYAAGNAFQDGLAHYRRHKGLKATSIDLGAVADIGYLAENAEAYESHTHLMKMAIKEDEIQHIFLAAISGTIKDDYEMPPQLITGIIGGEALRSLMPSVPWANDSKFSLLRKADGKSAASTGASEPTRDTLSSAETLVEAERIVETALVAKLAKALGISPEDINIEQPLHAYGVDSLIAVEIRNWVLKELKSDVSILDILSALPIHTLALKISMGSKALPQKLRAEVSDV